MQKIIVMSRGVFSIRATVVGKALSFVDEQRQPELISRR